MLYNKKSYLLMALSLVLILVGFVLMSGGGSDDPEVFNPEIFSTRRIVVAPMVCLAGFVLMGYAIIAPSRRSEVEGTTSSEEGRV